jgi:nucleolar protein 4
MNAAHGGTCFVRNLPASVGEQQLQQLFSDVGPVKKAFLVREKGAHKGLAYVTYALARDATQAAQRLNGKVFSGSAIHVRFDKQPRPRQFAQLAPS